jgi:hypothetical protein
MANPQLNHTYRMSRATLGNFRSLGGGSRNILGISYGFTNTKKIVGTASTTAIHAAITGSATVITTTTTAITDPDVPRALTVTSAGTAGDIATGDVTITGTNVEGKVITEAFTFAADTAATITGAKAFKTVTSIAIPVQDGAAATFAVGTSTKIGLNHRLATTATAAGTVRVVSITTAGVKTLQAAPTTLAASATLVESNTVIPATVPNGTTAYSIHYFFYNWALDPTNGINTFGA